MKRGGFLTAVVVILIHSLSCLGQYQQDSIRTYRIETTDGNVFVGTIVEEGEQAVVLRTDLLGDLRIPHSAIKSKTEIINPVKTGTEYWLPNPQSSRYFWAPNGYGLEKQVSYYQNIWVLYNQFSFGLTGNFSVGAGTLPLFLFGGTATPVWVVPKLSIPVVKEKFNLGTGAFVGTLLGEDTGAFGLLYGTTTIGSRDKNFSIGLAYGFSRDDWMKKPIINFSGIIRTGPRGYLITENYYISIEDMSFVIFSLGGRSMIRNVGLDYSLWIPAGSEVDSFVALPFLGITVPINKKK